MIKQVDTAFTDVDSIKDLIHELLPEVTEISTEPLAGLSNVLYLVTCDDHKWVLRLRSEDALRIEQERCKFLVNYELTPGPIIFFRNGFLSPYIPGRLLDRKADRAPEILSAIAKEMIRLHQIPITTNAAATTAATTTDITVWERMNNWMDQLTKETSCYLYKELKEEISKLRTEIEQLDPRLLQTSYCHNDLPYENIIWTGIGPVFIDWEYAGLNYRAYDVANFFQEWAGNNLDSNLLLTSEEEEVFLNSYSQGLTPKDLHLFRCLSDLHWTIWALYLQYNSTAIDFDYFSYALRRYRNYLRLRNHVSCSDPEVVDPVVSVELKLNDGDRFSPRIGEYIRICRS